MRGVGGDHGLSGAREKRGAVSGRRGPREGGSFGAVVRSRSRRCSDDGASSEEARQCVGRSAEERCRGDVQSAHILRRTAHLRTSWRARPTTVSVVCPCPVCPALASSSCRLSSPSSVIRHLRLSDSRRSSPSHDAETIITLRGARERARGRAKHGECV